MAKISNFNKEVGIRVSQLRERRKLTREKLGELSHISDRFIYDIETGQKGMSAETLYNISKALNVTSDYILFGSESGENNFSDTIKVLSRLSKQDQDSIEKIIVEICSMLSNKSWLYIKSNYYVKTKTYDILG